MYARMYARVYARAYDCQDTTRDTGTLPEKSGTQAKHKTKFVIVGRSTRKQRKKVKKSLEIRK